MQGHRNLPWHGWQAERCLASRSLLLFGLSNTNSSGLPLPFDLGIAGAPGCSLLASIDDIQATNNVLGTAVWSLAVPTLPGASFYVQSVAFEASANSLGVVLSNAGHGTLGWTHGAGSGKAIAELISGQQPELALRFLGFPPAARSAGLALA